jgi:hypothetical protein
MGSANAPEGPGSTPSGDRSARASIARVYDAALGGTDNYAIDRQVLDQVRAVAPEVNDLAWSNRRFLGRAVRFLADQGGIRQFLDCGSGLPTAENTHQIARRVDASTRVVYVDNDPTVITHSEALLAGDESCRVVDADIFRRPRCWGTRPSATCSTSPSRSACSRSARCTTTSGMTAPS